MIKVRKVFILLVIIISFLCQNVAFCLPEGNFTLRPPSQFNKPMEDFIKNKDQEKTIVEAIDQLKQITAKIENMIEEEDTEQIYVELDFLEEEVMDMIRKLDKLKISSEYHDAYIDALVSIILTFPTKFYMTTADLMDDRADNGPSEKASNVLFHESMDNEQEISLKVWESLRLNSKKYSEEDMLKRLKLGMAIAVPPFKELEDL